ncbi:MAG: general secretion pathway protein E [Mariniblastus sp.]|jgi:general secretion pathway protein E
MLESDKTSTSDELADATPNADANTPELLDMDQVKIDPVWALRIPANLATRRQILPFTLQGGEVLIACKDPDDDQSIQAVRRYVSEAIKVVPAEHDSLFQAIQRIFQDTVRWNGNQSEPVRIQFTGTQVDPDSDNLVALGDEIFHAALIRQATDIHIEPASNSVRIRLRVDGVLDEYRQLPIAVHHPLLSRLKVMSGMDIAERRAPQDGRFTLSSEHSSEIDIRTATIPTKHGERMTLRLLATQTQDLTLGRLGMSAQGREQFEHVIDRPNGLILITGPTGCGKSTTLYAAIRNLINRKSLNVITIEDPVEYVIEGISQVEVDANDKVSFHKALRSSLRHDPDVLMIGEIRDQETAETAIRAALTGHLVFTTLHANSAVGAITRLADMGIKPFLIGAVSRLFAAQRLVRKLCQQCRVAYPLSESESLLLARPSLTGTTVYEPGGCQYCAGTGFMGRIGLFEFITFDREIARTVASRPDETHIQELLAQRKTPGLLDDAIEKIIRGETSVEQIATVISPY